MAYQFSAIFCGASEQVIHKLITFIARETRPLFEEDVEEDDRELFLSIEDLDFPTSWSIKDNLLCLNWFEVDGFDIKSIRCIRKLDFVEFVLAFEIPDDPMAGDEEEDSWYWVNMGENIKRVDSKSVFKFCSKDIIKIISD